MKCKIVKYNTKYRNFRKIQIFCSIKNILKAMGSKIEHLATSHLLVQ